MVEENSTFIVVCQFNLHTYSFSSDSMFYFTSTGYCMGVPGYVTKMYSYKEFGLVGHIIHKLILCLSYDHVHWQLLTEILDYDDRS